MGRHTASSWKGTPTLHLLGMSHSLPALSWPCLWHTWDQPQNAFLGLEEHRRENQTCSNLNPSPAILPALKLLWVKCTSSILGGSALENEARSGKLYFSFLIHHRQNKNNINVLVCRRIIHGKKTLRKA